MTSSLRLVIVGGASLFVGGATFGIYAARGVILCKGGTMLKDLVPSCKVCTPRKTFEMARSLMWLTMIQSVIDVAIGKCVSP